MWTSRIWIVIISLSIYLYNINIANLFPHPIFTKIKYRAKVTGVILF